MHARSAKSGGGRRSPDERSLNLLRGEQHRRDGRSSVRHNQVDRHQGISPEMVAGQSRQFFSIQMLNFSEISI